MRAEAALAERRLEVRSTATLWHKSGVIDETALGKIHERYSDDRVRVGPTFRVLFFLFTLFAAHSAISLFAMLLGSPRSFGMLALIVGVGCVALTEYLTGPRKRSQGGIEAATSFLALSYLMIGVAWLLTGFTSIPTDGDVDRLLLLGAALAAAAAWRWGYWIYAVAAAELLFFVAARTPLGRTAWVCLPLMLWSPLVQGCDSPKLAPSHRHCMRAILIVSILTLYFAINFYSVDHALLEGLSLNRANRSLVENDSVRFASILLTALFPLGLIVWGVRSRRRLLLNLGVILGVLSLLTLRAYFHLIPAWLLFCVSGLVALGAALFFRRFLNSGNNKERGGFTAASLFEDTRKRRTLEVLSTVATLTPEAPPTQERPRVSGGGGEFGGGGASGTF